MLDRASLERLSRAPEQNAPLLNVALAEEGDGEVLLSLARSPAVGPDALEVVLARIEREGDGLGRGEEPDGEETSPVPELERLLVAHPRASDGVRDRLLARHADEPYFVLAAACHAAATRAALERAARWGARSALHDRPWLALLDPGAFPPFLLDEWAHDPDPLLREAAARHARDAALLASLARDPARRVRRALASNRFAARERAELSRSDPAPDVRARAAGALTEHAVGEAASITRTARFANAERAMAAGGALAADTVRALSTAVDGLDPEGALLSAQHLPPAEAVALLEQAVDLGLGSPHARAMAAGLAMRAPVPGEEEDAAAAAAQLAQDVAQALGKRDAAPGALTGKARLAAWLSESLLADAPLPPQELAASLARARDDAVLPLPLGCDRLVLGRSVAGRRELLIELCRAGVQAAAVPVAVIELAWREPAVDEGIALELARRVARPPRRAEDLPEDEVDLDPLARPLSLLEPAVLALAPRASVAPRAALTVVALESRRVRYVLSAMPQWKNRLTGGNLARVLRSHAGALSAARAVQRSARASVEAWTDRMLTELEAAVALAVGHLTAEEVVRRMQQGRLTLEDGTMLAHGLEARAAIEGAPSVAPLLEWAAPRRTTTPAAAVLWLLLEALDRPRPASLLAATIDALAGSRTTLAPGVCEALATLERRRPGRLELIFAQTPRGKATLASALARAYRALGGLRGDRPL